MLESAGISMVRLASPRVALSSSGKEVRLSDDSLALAQWFARTAVASGHWSEGWNPDSEIEAFMGRIVTPEEEALVKVGLQEKLLNEQH